jgi:hypothetical protein
MPRFPVLLVLCVFLISAAAPGAPAEVHSGEWSHQAIQHLAARGLVHGYQDARFLRDRALTRFEMASLVKRVLDNVARLPAALLSEQPGETPSDARSEDPAEPVPPPDLRPLAALQEEDVERIRRLVAEYSVELAVIGADPQPALDRLEALEGRVDQLEALLRDPRGPLQQAIDDVRRIDRLRISGFVQGRFEAFEHTQEAELPGLPPIAHRFTLPRIRLTAVARPTDRILARFQIEGAGIPAPGPVAATDAWIAYFLGAPDRSHAVTFGQMIVPFGLEVTEPSSVREAPERARVARFFYPFIRDRGVKVSSAPGRRYLYEVGVYNGLAPGQPGVNRNDNNNDKHLVARLRGSPAPRLHLGVSGEIGRTLRTYTLAGEPMGPGGPATPFHPIEERKLVLGGDFQWHLRPGTELRGEYIWGRVHSARAHGYIAQVLHAVDPDHTLVVKYDWFGVDRRVLAPLGGGATPVGDNVPYEGTLSNLALGVVRRLDASTRLKLFYEIHEAGRRRLPEGPGPEGRVPWQGNILRLEVITLF